MNKMVLSLKNINKAYKGKTETLEILKDLNLEVREGEFISIIGKSGSGKSTLLNVIGLLDKFDSGELMINGKFLGKNKLKAADKDKLKNEELGFVFQSHYLLPEFTALENVMMPALVRSYKRREAIEDKARELLEEVGLGERMNHKPSMLSGGEKQRVAIARALINNPKIILADEPTGNLDEETSEAIHALFKRINKERKQTIIVVTHSRELASLTTKKYVMKDKKLSLEN